MTALFRNKRFWAYSGVLLILPLLWWRMESAAPIAEFDSFYFMVQGISPAVLDKTELLCSGHVSQQWNPFTWSSIVKLKWQAPHAKLEWKTTYARRRIVPFHVDHYWKGSGPAEIEIALFQPINIPLFQPGAGWWQWAWMFPAEENLLLAVKKDTTGSDAYQLVNQINSWLVIRSQTGSEVTETTPEKEIAAVARDYLEAYAAGTEEKKPIKLAWPMSIGSPLLGAFLIDNRFVIDQTLAAVAEFKVNDDKTLTMVEKLVTNPESRVRSSALWALVKSDPARGWKLGFDLYQSGTLSRTDHVLFPNRMGQAITAESLAKINPSEIQKMMNSDDVFARRQITMPFMSLKGNRAIALQGLFLTSSDIEVQYCGMMGIAKEAGLIQPNYSQFREDPEKYLAPCKTWLTQHPGDALPLPSAPK